MGRRRAPVMSFQEAFNLTRGLTGSIMSAREVDKLGPDAEAVKGVGLKITAPDGTQSTGVLDPAAGGDFDAITKAYTDQGYKVEKVEQPQYAARAGSRDTGIYTDESAAKMGAREANQGLNLKRADVYEKYGLEDKAKGLRAEARQDRLDMQGTQRHEQQMAAGKLDLDAKKRAAKQTAVLDAGLAALNQMEFDSPDARASALVSVYEKAFGPKEAMEIRNLYTNQDLAAMQLQSKKLDHAWDMAFKSNNADKVAEVYDQVNNDRSVKVVRGKSGIEVIEFDPSDVQGTARVVARGKDDAEIVDKVRMLVTPGAKLEWAKYELDKLKTEAAVRASNASARASDANATESYAKAGLANRTDPGADSNGAKFRDMTGYANSLNSEVANIDRALTQMGPPMKNESPEMRKQRQALALQRNEAMRSLRSVRQEIEHNRMGLGGDRGPEVGQTGASDKAKAELMNMVADEVRSGKMTLEDANAGLRQRGITYSLTPEDVAPPKNKGLKPRGVTGQW